jgi:integrase
MAPKKRNTRRSNGEGSVYQNPDGSYTAALRINGRLVRRRAADTATAEALRRELVRQRDQGVAVGEGGQSLQTWLNAWFAQKARALKPKTLAEYRRIIEAYILPALGDTPLNRLRPDMLQALINSVEDDIKAEGRYSGTRSARAVGALLKEALTMATERRLIPYSPMAGVVLPKPKTVKVTPPTEAQIAALLDAAQGDPLEPLWHLYALLGLRRGEGLGLRWSDYDATARTLRVAQQVQEIGGALIIGTPKSEAGERVLPLPAVVCPLLDARRARQLAGRIKRADTWTDHDLIFCSRDGAPLWPRNVEDSYYALKAKAALPDATTLHHLRHAVSTLLDEHGASEALKADILGHTKQTITQHYTHGRLDAMRRALEGVAAAVAEQRRAG